jgi:hypothetical protein
MAFVTEDSGERREFGTGSVRDTNAGKLRVDLIPLAALVRWAGLMGRGAEKYGERNWELGQSMRRFGESAQRHLTEYLMIAGGEFSDEEVAAAGVNVREDHLAGVLFNIGGIMHHEAAIVDGRLPADLDDRRAPAREPLRFLTLPKSEIVVGSNVRIMAAAPYLGGETAYLIGRPATVVSLSDETDDDGSDVPAAFLRVEGDDEYDGSYYWRLSDLELISDLIAAEIKDRAAWRDRVEEKRAGLKAHSRLNGES